jgi:hypothetical protein
MLHKKSIQGLDVLKSQIPNSVTKTERRYLTGRMMRYQINRIVDRITEERKEDNGKLCSRGTEEFPAAKRNRGMLL